MPNPKHEYAHNVYYVKQDVYVLALPMSECTALRQIPVA